MSATEDLRKFPLTTVTVAFLTGFAASSGLTGATVAAVGAISKNPAVRRVALVAWPIVRSNLTSHARARATGFVKDVFNNVTQRGDTT